MKVSSGGVILSALVALLAMALPVPAGTQAAVRAKGAAAAPKYEPAKEVTIEGTVASMVTESTPGLLVGAHAILTTASGALDAHLGNYATRGASALVLAVGERVKMVGVMVTVGGRPVLLVRTAQTGRGIFTIRNAHGFPLRPASSSATRPQKDARGGQS
ncbi:MAG: hypothetical protein ABSG19_01665 [Candidatus Aminicenantales bacterium]